MTDRELLVAARGKLTALAERALHLHRTKATRSFIVYTHMMWQNALDEVILTDQPVSESTQVAFAELNHAVERVIDLRGSDPDGILRWIDLYPSIVTSVHLHQPEKVVTRII
jgi:hypothetical protein